MLKKGPAGLWPHECFPCMSSAHTLPRASEPQYQGHHVRLYSLLPPSHSPFALLHHLLDLRLTSGPWWESWAFSTTKRCPTPVFGSESTVAGTGSPQPQPHKCGPDSSSESQTSRNGTATCSVPVTCRQIHMSVYVSSHPTTSLRTMARPSPSQRRDKSGSARMSHVISVTQLIHRNQSRVYSQSPDSELPFLEVRAEEKRRPSHLHLLRKVA